MKIKLTFLFYTSLIIILLILSSCEEQITQEQTTEETDAKAELMELVDTPVFDDTVAYEKTASTAGQEIDEVVSGVDAQWKETVKDEINKAEEKGYDVQVVFFSTGESDCYVYFYDAEEHGLANGVLCFREDGLVVTVIRSLYVQPVRIVAEGYSYEDVEIQAAEIISISQKKE